MTVIKLRCRTLASTVAPLALVCGLASPAFAQDAPTTSGALPEAASAEAGPSDDSDVIVVTGSLIPRPNLTSQSPITIVDSKDIQLSGLTRVEDIINSLPQSYASQSSGISNGSDGTATVNLRNLGDTRTLILVDGHRLPPGDPSREAGSTLGSASDVNNIPAILVKRIDVLTGGASAAYGADAVAGVVNFILDREFTGLKFDVQGGIFQHDNNSRVEEIIAADPRGFPYPRGGGTDGRNIDASVAYGTKFGDDRGHITAFASYHKQKPVVQGARDYSSCGLTTNGVDTSFTDNLSCFGSRNSAVANFISDGGAGDSFIVEAATRGQTVRDFDFNDRYNFNPLNYYQRPDRRINAGLFIDYEINDSFKPYADFLFMDDKSVAQIAPSGTFGNIFTINCSNPFLTPAEATALGCAAPGPGSLQTVDAAVFKRNVEGGPRQDDLRHRAFRILGGMKGEISSAWSYDATAQLGKTIYKEKYLNDFSFARVRNAINACLNPDGTPVADTACAPYNIFTGTTTIQPTAADGVTQEAIDYISTPGRKSGYTKEIVVRGVLQGKLGDYGIKSPWAGEAVSVALGAEYRKESILLKTDTAYSTGDLLGQGGETKPSSGSFDVKELFVEARIPLLEDVTGFQSLVVDAAYRYSYYSTVKRTDTWKFGFDWSPFAGDLESAVRFRGSINRAVRAPTLQDLFAPAQLGLGGTDDPCAEGGRTLEECRQTGRNDPNFDAHYLGGIAFNPASQYNSQSAGAQTAGSTLQPETATTKTIGVVLTPKGALRGLVATLDYYTINLRNTIKTDGFDLIMTRCLETGSDYYCNLIRRDPTNGSLWLGPGGFIVDPIYNAGRLKNSGIDVDIGYSLDLDRLGATRGGTLNFALTGSRLLTQKIEVTDHSPTGELSSAGFFDCVGYYGDNCGVPNPKWRHKLRVTWLPNPSLAISVNWRHIGGTKWEARDPNPLQPASITNEVNVAGRLDRIKSVDYFDTAVSADVGEHLGMRVGVNNLLDRDPPIINGADFGSSYVNGNTYPGTYDALGRYFFAGLSVKY